MRLKKYNLRYAFVIVGSLCALSTSSVSYAEQTQPPVKKSYDYVATMVAKTNSCDQEAVELGKRIAGVTGFEIQAATCLDSSPLKADGKEYMTYRLLVSYMAEAQFFPYVAIFGESQMNSTRPQDLNGVFATFDACLAAQATQAPIFAQQTGLAVLTSSCERSSLMSGSKYVLKIEGIGTPKKQLFNFIPGSYGHSGEDLSSGAAKLLNSAGASVIQDISGNIFFYSETPIPIQVESFGLFGNESECRDQVGLVQQMYSRIQSVNSYTRCNPLPRLPGQFSLDSLRIGGLLVVGDSGYRSLKYNTYPSCMKDRVRIMEKAKREGVSAVGALCKRDVVSQFYIVELLEVY